MLNYPYLLYGYAQSGTVLYIQYCTSRFALEYINMYNMEWYWRQLILRIFYFFMDICEILLENGQKMTCYGMSVTVLQISQQLKRNGQKKNRKEPKCHKSWVIDLTKIGCLGVVNTRKLCIFNQVYNLIFVRVRFLFNSCSILADSRPILFHFNCCVVAEWCPRCLSCTTK